jgi:PAS domain S-box-containing protein
VAGLPAVVEAFKSPDPSSIIQPVVENIRKDVGAQFIVVGNMNLIRYSHPNPAEIGKHMVGEDDDRVLHGEPSITEATGTLGLSIRGKYPIFDQDHKQIGVVSVGFLVDDIWKKLSPLMFQILGVGAIALFFGIIGAFWLSAHIKKSIFNLEPHEIALLARQQTAILESIREGIIAVDMQGQITTCNREAKNILELEEEEIVGKSISAVIPQSRLMEVIQDASAHFDQPMIIASTLVVVNRVPITINGEVIGAVASFRDKLQLDQLDNRLSDIGQYADTLRSQRHEFMNKLHLISGLISMEEYGMVQSLIADINNEQQTVLNLFLARVRDPAIVGVLIGKLHRAKELGIQLTITPESRVSELCPNREIIVTILGNAIENALEAMKNARTEQQNQSISVFISDQASEVLLTVQDTGPGVDPKLGDRIFEDGVTTKGPGRGFGLALLSRLVARAGGDIRMLSSPEGAALKVSLPK